MLSGGYLGMVGEVSSALSRISNDSIDPLVIGKGSSRFHNQDTALSAIVGPAYHYPKFVKNTFNDAELDNHDWNRIKGMVWFNTVPWIDTMFNQINQLSED